MSVARDQQQMRYLSDMERRIRRSVSCRDKPEIAELAIKGLYLAGAGNCGGPMWEEGTPQEVIVAYVASEKERERRFEDIWARDPERARQVDWQRIDLGDDEQLR